MELTPQQTIKVGTVSMTLERVSVAPSETEIRLTYDMPDASDWQPVAALTIGDSAGQLGGYQALNWSGSEKASETLARLAFPSAVRARGGGESCAGITEATRCAMLTFNIFHGAQPAPLTLTISRLQTELPEDPNIIYQIRDLLARQGIAINPIVSSHRFDYDLIHAPAGVDATQAYNDAYDSLRRRVDGPWVFTIQLPS